MRLCSRPLHSRVRQDPLEHLQKKAFTPVGIMSLGLLGVIWNSESQILWCKGCDRAIRYSLEI